MRAKGIYFVYRFLQALGAPAVILYFLIRCVRSPGYWRTLGERLGHLPALSRQTRPGAIWLHAVSVGEVLAAIPLIKELQLLMPGTPVVVSTSTLSGRKTAEEKLGGSAEAIFYAPLDYAFAVRRALRAIQPAMLVVLETEIWPNLFREAQRSGCGVMIVSGRISDRVAGRYRHLQPFFRAVLLFADRILTQSEEMRARFLAAGARPATTLVGGNLKYDFDPVTAPEDSPVRAWLKRGTGPVWIAASTSADDRNNEEDAVLAAWRAMPGWRLILAPRKPERFGPVAAKLQDNGVPFARRSSLSEEDCQPVLLLDSLGELSGLFSMAEVVFMGGSLVNRGGHNILEPAFSARPIVTGPHLENFREIAEDFIRHNAIIQIGSADELHAAVLRAAADPELGARAQQCTSRFRGAAALAAATVQSESVRRLPRRYPNFWSRLFLGPIAAIWRAASLRRAKLDRLRQKRLQAAVISVGNITAGGTGKTPIVLHLANLLRQDGHAPAILSRGYGRTSPHKVVTLPPGAQASVIHTGDEPQIFLRSGVGPLGIGANRFEAGEMIQQRFQSDVFLLDDGFQHGRLARDLDIVLIDALQPFGGFRILPEGRLREPLGALNRANVFILTRTEHALCLPAIELELRRWNYHAPIYRSRTVPKNWVRSNGEQRPADNFGGERVAAFCGLGNPQSFWDTLEDLGVNVVERFAFDDHHRYTPGQLRRMLHCSKAAGAAIMVTTQKDLVNLCADCDSLLPGIALFWLEIGVQIEGEAELLGKCRSALAHHTVIAGR